MRPLGWFSVLLLGCAGEGGDSSEPELPPDSEPLPFDSTPDTFLVDTSLTDSGFTGEPANLLTITYTGAWQMTPRGGPYTNMTGSLLLTEVLDGNDLEPVCTLEFALTGEESEESCADCTATFEVLHYLVTGEDPLCSDPDRPTDGAIWRLGWIRSEESIEYDWQGTGVWIPWFEAEQTGDDLLLSWEVTVGVGVEDTGT